MAATSTQMIGVIASLLAVLLHIFTNIGTTFTSTFLPKLYFVQALSASTGQSIRYGVYNSCLFKGESLQSCTKTAIGYSYAIPATQAKLHQAGGIIIFLAAILATVSLLGGAAVGHYQRHNAPRAIAAGAALASLLATCIGIALNIYSYWTTLAMAKNAVQGLSYGWGPTLGTLAAAGFCLIIALIAYIASCFSRRDRTRDSFPLYDYEFGHDNRHYY
ncbi:hypothetical protein NQZ79_g6508 [Umbelopsis isabellina]|nr:hypothetical protein NQZ79_g6508 [Umbelopsis isabellina]